MTRLRTLGRKLQPSSAGKLQLPAKQTAAIYHSPEYQAWRAAVIRRAGGRCETPGCGRVERRMFADHRLELRDGGAPFDPANGQCLCGSCHTAKTAAARATRR